MSARRPLTWLPHGLRAAMISVTVSHKCGSSSDLCSREMTGASVLLERANFSSLQRGRGAPGALCVCVRFFLERKIEQ